MMSPRFAFSRMSGKFGPPAAELADSFEGRLEHGEVVDLHWADGGEDRQDVEAGDFE